MDDIELGASGLVSKLVKRGCEVRHLVLSVSVESLPDGYSSNDLVSESAAASSLLGVDKCVVRDYPTRKFPHLSSAILQEFVDIKRSFLPDLILIPSSFDQHQDHKCVHDQALRAFKDKSIIGYNLPWNNFTESFNLYVPLNDIEIADKYKILKKFRSQSHREYFDEEYFLACHRYYGSKVSSKFAEAYEVIKCII